MKITRLAALAKEYKSMTIVDTWQDGEVVRQHVVIYGAIYPLDGFPLMDKESMMIMLDVPEEKRKEYTVHRIDMNETLEKATADLLPTPDGQANICRTWLEMPTMELIHVRTQGGIVFMQRKYQQVIEKEKEVDWWSRSLPGGVMLIAKRGFETIASISAETAWTSEDVLEELQLISSHARELHEKRRQKDDSIDQLRM